MRISQEGSKLTAHELFIISVQSFMEVRIHIYFVLTEPTNTPNRFEFF